jgi:hypothetical protein
MTIPNLVLIKKSGNIRASSYSIFILSNMDYCVSGQAVLLKASAVFLVMRVRNRASRVVKHVPKHASI